VWSMGLISVCVVSVCCVLELVACALYEYVPGVPVAAGVARHVLTRADDPTHDNAAARI